MKGSMPWKVDLYLAVVDPKSGMLGPWHAHEGADMNVPKGDPRSEAGILLADDEVADSMNFRIRVVRRFAGDMHPFHLTLPVSQQSGH